MDPTHFVCIKQLLYIYIYDIYLLYIFEFGMKHDDGVLFILYICMYIYYMELKLRLNLEVEINIMEIYSN